VTARREILAERLAARGREAPEDVTQRLDRQVDLVPDSLIVNEGPIEITLVRFLEALEG
jgi:ribose 1,5-bisphosphokinase PhnN